MYSVLSLTWKMLEMQPDAMWFEMLSMIASEAPVVAACLSVLSLGQ